VLGRTPRLLVIEDAEDQATLVGAAARHAHPGLDVRTVGDGLEGIAYLAGIPPYHDRKAHPHPDLVILDLYLPQVDGFEVLSWVREFGSPAVCPVVVLTASARPSDEERALSLGATDYIRKPDDLDGLALAVREIVRTWIGTGEMVGAHIWAAG
jgi:DNA-binding response OmpR family regulator